MIELRAADLDTVIHVIQTALTPIFLLTAVAGLLGVFTTRLARISDQVDSLAAADPRTEADALYICRRLTHLRHRSHALDVAVILGTLAGACTCGTALTLFLGALRSRAAGIILFILFGLALCFAIGALTAFLTEMLLAGKGIRATVDRHTERLE
jgi:hypothetical protein